MSALTAFSCSVHTHADFCDGKNTLEEMAAAAYAAGVKYYGVSCHSHTPIDLDEGFVLPADMTAYREAVLHLREQYAGDMEILLGVEWDICSDLAVPDWADYWIGSVHNLYDAESGRYYCVDWQAEELERCRDEWFGGDMLSVTEQYYRAVQQVAEKKPTILGHIDLVTKLNAGNRFFDEDAPRYKAAALAALHTVDPAVTVLEINTGAIARGYRDTPYPALFLLKEWHRMGGRIILTADAHTTTGILYGYDVAAAAAKAAGFDRAVILTSTGFAECPLA